jgi:hypothetical protein
MEVVMTDTSPQIHRKGMTVIEPKPYSNCNFRHFSKNFLRRFANPACRRK